MTEYRVYKVRYHLGMQDPDMLGKRYHTVIFVETEKDGSGFVHHVTGDIVKGMEYQRREADRPELSQSYHDKQMLGTIEAATYPGTIDRICRAHPPPGAQKGFNRKTMRTEPMKPDGTFYEAGEEKVALKKCTEWTEQDVIPALQKAQVFVTRAN